MNPPDILLPKKAITLDEVIELAPVLRQSLIAKFDDCPLSAWFEMRYSNGWTTHPAARGVIFHRVAAECLREMVRHDSASIPVGTALAILEEMLRQDGIEPEERVRVPMREIPALRTLVAKFAKDNQFSVRHIIDVEKRLEATITYVDADGMRRERAISGKPDALIADRKIDNGAILIDWKSGWAIPGGMGDDIEWPEKNGSSGVSYHAFVQLRLYGWLVMRNYPSVDVVTLREFYPRRSVARTASIHRGMLPSIEEMISDIVRELDYCLASGPPKRLRFPDVAPWNPSPGKHCYWCVMKTRCPIESGVREEITVGTEKEARRAVAELEVIEAARGSRRESLRTYVEENGPVASKWSKGRRVLGLRTAPSGKQALTFFTPEGADRSAERRPVDDQLEEALKESVQAARAERDAAPEKPSPAPAGTRSTQPDAGS